MAVRHKDVTVRRNGNTCGPIEGIWTIPGYPFFADRHQHLPCRTQLQDLLAHDHSVRILSRQTEDLRLVIDVGRPQISFPVDGKPVRIREELFAKTSYQLAGRIKFQYRRIRLSAT